jgi:hypothetical protein
MKDFFKILASFYISDYLLELRTESGDFENFKGFFSKFGDYKVK